MDRETGRRRERVRGDAISKENEVLQVFRSHVSCCLCLNLPPANSIRSDVLTHARRAWELEGERESGDRISKN